jgi:hypothetical protein
MNPVVTVVPISVMMTPSPIAWRPSVISPSAPIPRAMDVVRTIGNRDGYRAWISIARVSAITRSIPPITSMCATGCLTVVVVLIPTLAVEAAHQTEQYNDQNEYDRRYAHTIF